MSIRSRLVVLVLAVLLPALVAASWVIYRTWQVGQAAQENLARDSAHSLATAVDREFGQHAALAQVLAASPLLDRAPLLSEADRAAFEQTARRATAGTPVAVQLVGEDRRWLDTRLPAGAPAQPRSSGDLALSEAPAVATLAPTPGAVADGALQVAVLAPVRRGEQAAAMNLRVLLPLSQLQALVDQVRAPPGWTGLLLDAQGQLVLRHAGATGQSGAASLVERVRESIADRTDGRLALQTGEGAPLRVFFSRAPRGWTYVNILPRERLGGALSREILQLALGALLLLGVAVGGALWVARDELRRRVGEAVARTELSERGAAQRERAQALGRLTGRVAHEFNNLLGVISNSAHLIQRHAETSPGLAMPVAATLRAVDGASRLTQHLLRFGGRQSAQPRTVALGEWLPGLREMLSMVLGKRIALAIDVPDAPLYARADPDELELAVINLALNARDVLPEGGHVGITAGLAPAAMTVDLPAGPYVFITVRDNGPGLDAAQARRVFEPFFTTKDGEPEAGFGLSQVHGLCVQAGGRAQIVSQPDTGTAVSLVLPAVAPDSGGAPARPRVASRAPLDARVLLTEDNDSLSDVTAALIENMGASVERARHAAQALERLERGPRVDVVLTDVSMPGGMDGLGLARAVRARWPWIRVVLISAYGQRLVGAEGFTVLGKPCPPQALLAALRGPAAGTPHAP